MSDDMLTWLVVMPMVSSNSEIHCNGVSLRRRQAQNSRPVVNIFRLPKIW